MATRKKSAKKPESLIAVTQERLLGTVHQVWLAGLGAVSKAQSGAPKLLNDLVTEGARVHARASKATDTAVRTALETAQTAIRERVGDVRETASDAFENLEKIFQTRVNRALKQIGVPSAEEIGELSKRVDVLNANIEKLARGRATAHKPRTGTTRKGAAHSASAA
jgi:poly(hydroxyalkanoate) granule-associated protein